MVYAARKNALPSRVASLEPLYFIHENSPVVGSSAETLAVGWESCTEPEQVAYCVLTHYATFVLVYNNSSLLLLQLV